MFVAGTLFWLDSSIVQLVVHRSFEMDFILQLGGRWVTCMFRWHYTVV